jgi:hypothetical protein
LKEGEIYVSKYVYRELGIDSCDNWGCYSCCCIQKDVTVMETRLFQRWPQNPIISPTDLPFRGSSVLNPGVTEQDDEVILILRVEDCTGCSNLHLARSKDVV